MTRQINDLIIEDAKIHFRNFSGRETKFNPAGRRNFVVEIDPSIVNELRADGWLVKDWYSGTGEGEVKGYTLTAHLNFGNYPPKVMLVAGKKLISLDENTVGQLDSADITLVDLDLRPYEWEPGHIKAYVRSMYVTIRPCAFDDKYNFSDEEPSLPF